MFRFFFRRKLTSIIGLCILISPGYFLSKRFATSIEETKNHVAKTSGEMVKKSKNFIKENLTE